MSSSVPPERSSSTARQRLAGALVLAFICGGVAAIWWSCQPGAAQLWRAAQAEADRERWAEALVLAERALAAGPPSLAERLLGGTIALHAGRWSRAEELFAQIDDGQTGAAAAQRRAGLAWLSVGRVAPAERALRRALRLAPTDQEARLALAELLRLSGRYFEIEPLLRELIDADACPSALLFAVAWPDKTWLDDEDRARIRSYLAADPDAAWMGLAVAGADALTAETRQAALERAQQAAQDEFAEAEALARWGLLLAEAGSWDRLSAWNRSLSDAALAHPQVWYVRGLWRLQLGERDAAVRCFWEALERGPFHAGATYQLSQLLPRTGARDQAAPYQEQARRLAELRQLVVFGKGAGGFPDADILRRIVGVLTELGREWEALGWCQLAAARHPQLPWPAARARELRQRLAPDAPWVAEESRVSRRVRLDQFPLPDFTAPDAGTGESATADSAGGMAFQNVADQRGLAFEYTNGSTLAAPQGLMYEISGGGAGVLDYDLDGWPDWYLTDGGPLLSQPRDPRRTDRLFRNQFGGHTVDVTASAGVVESGYGQGVAVGDVNADGFPDLFVGNIGPNQLWINQGDGTFEDATAAAGLTGAVWTMSAVFADLDGDGLTDLFEANYLGGDALTRSCRRDDVVVQCRPTMFPPEPDRLWLNQGDGRLKEATQLVGAHLPSGKGMGVVAADFEGRGRLSLFVANDMEPNAYFRNAAARGAAPRFADEAIPRGVAFSADGHPLSSMGIAVDDVDQDGRLDLYVTNFLSEGSNLYLQDADGAFTDLAPRFGLADKSFAVMGWGAQFLDADLDGWSDLIVANGHLEDYGRWNITSQMPTQVFRNRNGRALELLPLDAADPYFRGRYFGRSVVKFDGNRDGREDVLVTHVHAPVAWLENASRDVGHFLAIRLVGTASEREAIGTRLTISAAGKTWYKQLTAGDGFQVSNQRQVVCGLGAADLVDELQVDWPSGLSQRFSQLPTDREIVLREGHAEWLELGRADMRPTLPAE